MWYFYNFRSKKLCLQFLVGDNFIRYSENYVFFLFPNCFCMKIIFTYHAFVTLSSLINFLHWQCAMNFSSESIPNGIGFGGRANHLGLFLSANFDQGHTFPCTTFGSPCLSKTDRIIPEVIECWGIVPKGSEEETPNGLKGSVLERFKEERNMLNLVGLANSSK